MDPFNCSHGSDGKSIFISSKQLLELDHHILPVLCRHIRVKHALSLLSWHRVSLELVVVNPVNHIAVHLDKPAVTVIGKPLVAGFLIRPCTVSSLRPKFKTVSIIPGMETRALNVQKAAGVFCIAKRRP